MADTKISALSAGTALAGTEEIPGVQSAATVKFTPAQILTYVAANMTPITLTGGTVTSSTPVINATQTWNSGGTTFTGLKLNVTDTASASGSLLADLQVGGSSQFQFTKGAQLYFPTASTTFGFGSRGGGILGVVNGASTYLGFTTFGYHTFGTNQVFGFTGGTVGGSGPNVTFGYSSSGVIEVNNGTTGTFRDMYVRNMRLSPTAVGSLVAASTAGKGSMAYVTDANATTRFSTAAGGGANEVLVISDGTNWRIM